MAKKEYDPLDRVRSLSRMLPVLAVFAVPIIPTIMWALFGFLVMEWDVTKWVGEGRFVLVAASVAAWFGFVIGTKEYCKEKLKYSLKY